MVLKERDASNGAALGHATLPAWSFGQRHAPFKAPAGPGTGKYNPSPEPTNKTLAYRPELGTRGPKSIGRGEPLSGERYLQPGWLSTEKAGNAWSFGRKPAESVNGNPGPGTYHQNGRNIKAAHATWGPPPVCRATAKLGPAPGHVYPGDTSYGPLIHRQLPLNYDNGVPAPHDYQPATTFPPRFSRYTFGHRQPVDATTESPGPAYYEPASTVAAATMRGTVAPLMPYAHHANVSAKRHY